MGPQVRNQQFAHQAQDRPRVRALVVEDNVDDLSYLSTVLRAQGCDVVACASHEEALLRLQVGSFQFIVVTQGSCAFEGRRVLERAIEINRHTPVLVLTRCLEMSCYLEAMQLGAVDYLEKPVSPEQIAWVLETHLPRGVTGARGQDSTTPGPFVLETEEDSGLRDYQQGMVSR